MSDIPAQSPGPDFNSFGSAGAAGGIVGTNPLQATVDKLTKTVTQFGTDVSALSKLFASGGPLAGIGSQLGGGLLGRSGSLGGTNGGTAAPAAGGFPAMINPYAPAAPGAAPGAPPAPGAAPGAGALPGAAPGAPQGLGFPSMINPFSAIAGTPIGSPAPVAAAAPPAAPAGFPPVINPYAAASPLGSSPYTMPPTGAWPSGPVPGAPTPFATGAGGGFPAVINPFSANQGGADGAPATSTPLPMMGGSGGAPTAPAPMMGSGGGQQQGGGSSMLPGLGASASGIVAGLAQAGSNNMTGQLALNTYQYGGQLAMGGQTYAGGQKALGQQAYGTAGNMTGTAQQVPAVFGQSPQDLAQAYATMGANAGNPMLNQTGIGRNLLTGTSQFGYLNPAMSGAQSAQAMSNLYTPQQSLQERMLGYQGTPLQGGKPGASSTPAAWAASQFTAWGLGPGHNLSPAGMQAQLGPRGIISQNLQAEGLNPSQYTPMLETYNKLFQGIGDKGQSHPALNTAQAQKLMGSQGLSSTNPKTKSAAEATLQKYGVDPTDLNRLKSLASTQAGGVQDKSAGFTAGLQTATRALSDFSTALNKALNQLHANNAVGAGQAMSSILKNPITSGISGLALGGGLMHGLMGGKLLQGIKGMLGGGGAGDAGAAGGDAAAAGGTGAMGLGAVASTAGLGIGALGAQLALHAGLSHLPGASTNSGVVGRGANFAKAATPVGGLLNPLGAIKGMFGSLFGGSNVTGGGAAAPAAAGGSTPRTGGSKSSSGVPGKAATQASLAAESQIGVPYAYGKEIPKVGFDCASLMQWSYGQAGVYLPRTAVQQENYLKRNEVDRKHVEEGDLLFQTGAGSSDHEAMVINKGSAIVEAPSVGQNIRMRSYNPAEWKFAARPMMSHKGAGNRSVKPNVVKGNIGGGGGAGGSSHSGGITPNPTTKGGGLHNKGKASGEAVAAYARSMSEPGNRHPYAWGGGTPGGWDCSGFSAYVYSHFGYLGGNKPGTRDGTAAIQQQGLGGLLEKSHSQPGAMVFFGTPAYHVGIDLGGGKYAGADGPQGAPNRIDSMKGNSGVFRIPKGGFGGRGGGSAGGGGGSGSSAGNGQTLSQVPIMGSTGGGGGATPMYALGEESGEGSTSEVDATMGALSGGAGAGSGYYGTRGIVGTGYKLTGNGGSGGGGGAGSGKGNGGGNVGGSGGKGIFDFLMSTMFSGHKIAAAGAIASMWGESTWNPESVGSGGCGFMGWNLPSNTANGGATNNITTYGGTCHAAGIGHHSTGEDFKSQLHAITRYVEKTGGLGTVASMKHASTVLEAANLWGTGIEKFGINDVHPAGIAAAKRIAGLARGGVAEAGQVAMVGERGPELVKFGKQANVFTSAQSSKLMASAVAEGPHRAGVGSGTNYSTAHPAYGGGTGSAGMGGGAGNSVSLNFGSGSVVISIPNNGNTTLPDGASVRSMAKQFVTHLSKMDLYRVISSGANS